MPLTYITGAPGSGKTTILHALQTQGHEAYGTDEHGFSQWINRISGAIAIPPEKFDVHAWYYDHEWTLNPVAIASLKARTNATGAYTYLFGVADGTEQVWHNFDTVIVLTASEAELTRRIHTRTGNDFGKTPHELQIVLEWQAKHVQTYQEQGASILDTTSSSPDKIALDIVGIARV